MIERQQPERYESSPGQPVASRGGRRERDDAIRAEKTAHAGASSAGPEAPTSAVRRSVSSYYKQLPSDRAQGGVRVAARRCAARNRLWELASSLGVGGDDIVVALISLEAPARDIHSA